MLWLRAILPVIGHILNCVKGLNMIISFIRFDWQMGLDYSDIFIDLRTGTMGQRYWRLYLQIQGQTQDGDCSGGNLTFQRMRSEASR
jgi:hypothetical protein